MHRLKILDYRHFFDPSPHRHQVGSATLPQKKGTRFFFSWAIKKSLLKIQKLILKLLNLKELLKILPIKLTKNKN